ncbi:hypothetical protein Tco_0756688 [Tanacetum coccineum]
MVLQLTDFTSEITDEELREFTSEYYIPLALHPEVPAASASIADFPEGKVGVYTRFFEFANQRVPLSLFMCNVLNHYRLHISQLQCIGAAKISNFEVNCRLLAINPTVHLFRAFYHTSWSNEWVSFSKRAGRLQCYTEKLDALRRWREMFFWVDDALVRCSSGEMQYVGSLELRLSNTQGCYCQRDKRTNTPGSYSIEDAELINETPPIPDEQALASSEDADVAEVESVLGEAQRDYPVMMARSTVKEGCAISGFSRVAPSGSLVEEEFDMVTAQQAALVAQLRARFSNERSQSIQKDEEILLLKAQLVDAQAEAESSRSYAQHLAEEKMALLVKVEQERADDAEYKQSWPLG